MTLRRVLALIVVCSALRAHEPISTKLTWHEHIAPILQARCISCHHAGSAVAFGSYEEARPWAKAIKEMVLQRTMPPWGAVKGFGDFLNDPSLTPEEIARIADWVEGGAPEGKPVATPSVPPQPAPLPRVRPLPVRIGSALPRAVQLAGISFAGKGEVSDARLTAQRPDGSIEPLLWLRQHAAGPQTRYFLRSPLTLPAGTRLHVQGALPPLVLLVPVDVTTRRPAR